MQMTLEQKLIIDAVEVSNQFEESFTAEQRQQFADQNPAIYSKLKEVFSRLEMYARLCKSANTVTIRGEDIQRFIKKPQFPEGRISRP